MSDSRITMLPKELKINTFYNRLEADLPSEDMGGKLIKMRNEAEHGLLITIEPHWSKASRDQLGFMWWLCEKIAAAMDAKTPCTKDDVYRTVIKAAGESQLAIIENDKLQMRARMWAKSHEGNFSEEISPMPRGGKTKVRQYYGASTYDTAAMRRIIKALMITADKHGIDTTDAARKALINSK